MPLSTPLQLHNARRRLSPFDALNLSIAAANSGLRIGRDNELYLVVVSFGHRPAEVLSNPAKSEPHPIKRDSSRNRTAVSD